MHGSYCVTQRSKIINPLGKDDSSDLKFQGYESIAANSFFLLGFSSSKIIKSWLKKRKEKAKNVQTNDFT